MLLYYTVSAQTAADFADWICFLHKLCVYYQTIYCVWEVMVVKNTNIFYLFSAFLLCFWGTAYCKTVDIGSEKDPGLKIGFSCGNKYSTIGFLNPSHHRSAIKYDEFNRNLPPVDSSDLPTFDENNAKIRMFFKPNMRAWMVGRRREYLVGQNRWKLEPLQQGCGAKYSRYWQRGSNKIFSEVEIKFSESKAEIFVEAKFTNLSRNECQVDFYPAFSFLRNREFTFMMPRSFNGYIGGKPHKFYYGEKEVITRGDPASFWWRQVATKSDFIEFASRERIPFDQGDLSAPAYFSFVGLPGRTNLIWDVASLGSQKNMQYWEIGWDDQLAEAVPSWVLTLKRRESKSIKFRIVTVKGLTRVDAVNDNWIIGYSAVPRGTNLHLEFVPLVPVGDCELIGKVIKASGNIQSEQRVEIAAMHPFAVGGKVWQASDIFERSAFYPITLSVTPKDNSKLGCSISGVIVP